MNTKFPLSDHDLLEIFCTAKAAHPSRAELVDWVRKLLPDAKHCRIRAHCLLCKKCSEIVRSIARSFVTAEDVAFACQLDAEMQRLVETDPERKIIGFPVDGTNVPVESVSAADRLRAVAAIGELPNIGLRLRQLNQGLRQLFTAGALKNVSKKGGPPNLYPPCLKDPVKVYRIESRDGSVAVQIILDPNGDWRFRFSAIGRYSNKRFYLHLGFGLTPKPIVLVTAHSEECSAEVVIPAAEQPDRFSELRLATR